MRASSQIADCISQVEELGSILPRTGLAFQETAIDLNADESFMVSLESRVSVKP